MIINEKNFQGKWVWVGNSAKFTVDLQCFISCMKMYLLMYIPYCYLFSRDLILSIFAIFDKLQNLRPAKKKC